MSDFKHSSKLSATAADYYPTSMAADFSVMSFSRNYAFDPFIPGSAQMSSQIPAPFMIPSTAMPFHAPFMYIRPAFVDGISSSGINQFQPNHHSSELPRASVAGNRKNQNSQRNWPSSAQVRSQPQQPLQSSNDRPDSSPAAKSRKKKKKTKRSGEDTSNDLANSMAGVSIEDRHDTHGTSKSYSDALKRPLSVDVPSPITQEFESSTKASLPSQVIEEFPSLDASRNLKIPVTHSVAPHQPVRGVLRVQTEALESDKHRQGDGFKLNLANINPNVSSQQKKLKVNSSFRSERAKSPELTRPVSGVKSATPKKSSGSITEASPSSSDSPDRKPKYSKLKKVILEERKKRQQHATDAEENELQNTLALSETGTNNVDHDIDTLPEDEPVRVETISPADDKNLPVKSAGVVCNSYLTSALSALSKEDADAVCRRLHRRRFREYCNQVLGAALDDSTYLLLTTLGGFQQRQYEQNPVKAKLRRRYVCGLREAVKHIQLNKAKCIILAPNIERIPGKGGLDDMIGSIISQCASKNIPVVYALGRVALGRACSKPSPVSSVAIVSPAGAEDKFKQILELAQRAHESYIELVKMAVAEQLEQREHSTKNATQHEKAFAAQSSGIHVQFSTCHQSGHTRNASNISAISFISNISAMSDNSVGLAMPSNDAAEANNVPSDDDLEDIEDGDDFDEEADDDKEGDVHDIDGTL